VKYAYANDHIDIVKLLLQDYRVDWRKISRLDIVDLIFDEQNKEIESRLAQSYLTLGQIAPKTKHWEGPVGKRTEVSQINKKNHDSYYRIRSL